MDTYTQVKDAFYSGEHAFTGDRQAVRDIAFLVDKGYLNLRVFPIASRQKHLATLHTLDQNKHADKASGGSQEHIALKLLSGEYLQKKFGLRVQYEHQLCGYYPDVMTADSCIVVECGHTHNPEKMLTYFKQSDMKECILVPYPDSEKQIVLGYSFTASDELRKFLTFWDSEKRSEIQKKLRK